MSTTRNNGKKPKRTKKTSPRRQHHLRVRGIRRAEPDLRRLGRVLIDLAIADAEAAAERDHHRETPSDPPHGDRGAAA